MSWPAQLPDPARSRVVLVSVGDFHAPGLDALPQAHPAVDELADALAGPNGVLRWEQLVRIADPRTPGEVLGPLAAAAEAAEELLLFYYVGHGVLDETRRLHFALPDTDEGRVPSTALPAAAVLELLGGPASRARHRVAWLDCCFAGLALDLPGAGDVNLLTAADRTRKALAPPDGRTTAFAGALVELLREGVPDGPPHLELPLIHRRVEVTLGRVPDGMPKRTLPPNPCHRTTHTGADLALAVNPAHGTARTRAGLIARSRFAVRVALAARPGRPAQAVALFAEILRDAEAVLGPADPDTVRVREALDWARQRLG
ncbi:caspase, EACC1-associated type [Kitasatospora sp. LaBMicrA B282]|uniref:caspase, EACC1-associated type n=1 Tax=Kitasatospora sp. LaBMicrA B282 TaxID=3420949 RepID=UPI003D100119